MEQLQAIFLGGYFDMTKKMVSSKMDTVNFMEPPKDLKITNYDDTKGKTATCNILIYRLVSETPKGALIYEIDGE